MAYSQILVFVSILSCSSFMWCSGDFRKEVDIIWGGDKAKILKNGQVITLSLDRASGSGFQSKDQFLFGKISMDLKLVPGNSAGTVTSYYIASKGAMWDEIDFEFLGNLSGDPYTVHTNVITQGKGDREQQFRVWFDPTVDFHTYSILWNPKTIIFYVDGTPIREFKNMKTMNLSYPEKQAMRVHSSLWNGDDWATRGGRVKIDWSKAPFTAYYRNYEVLDCVWSDRSSNVSCGSDGSRSWLEEGIDDNSMKRLKWVQNNFMIYNYCNDRKRFRLGLARECAGVCNGCHGLVAADVAAITAKYNNNSKENKKVEFGYENQGGNTRRGGNPSGYGGGVCSGGCSDGCRNCPGCGCGGGNI